MILGVGAVFGMFAKLVVEEEVKGRAKHEEKLNQRIESMSEAIQQRATQRRNG